MSFHVRHVRWMLNVASVCTVGLAAGILYTGLSQDEEPNSSTTPPSNKVTSDSAAGPGAAAQPAPISGPWKTALRGPLQKPVAQRPLVIKPLPKPAVAPKPKPPELPIKLVGTILERGHSDLGIFADAGGKYELASVGDTLQLEPGGIRVKSIAETKAVVSLRGVETELQFKSGSKKGKGARNKPGRKNRP